MPPKLRASLCVSLRVPRNPQRFKYQAVENFMAQLAYTISEACALSKIGRTTMYAAIKDGQIKARKLRRRTVILHDDLMAFLQNLPEVGVEAVATALVIRD